MKKHPSSFRLALCALAVGFNLASSAVQYDASCCLVTVDTRQAIPTVTAWPTATAITYGQTLASSALTGGSATPAWPAVAVSRPRSGAAAALLRAQHQAQGARPREDGRNSRYRSADKLVK